jgi:hypothetical protein
VLDLLKRIHREGAALIVGTTRPEVAEAIGGRRLVLVEGRLRDVVPAGAPVGDFLGPFGAQLPGPGPTPPAGAPEGA